MAQIIDPLYDRNASFVGWLVDHSYVFDRNLKWVAYIFNRYIWSVKSQKWIGLLLDTNLLDRDGRILAWSTRGPVIGNLDPIEEPLDIGLPLTPAPPLIEGIPLNPGFVPVPIGEWSPLSFNQWLNQR